MIDKFCFWLAWAIIIGLLIAEPLIASPRADAFIRTLEASQGIAPGSTRVLPQCGCTIRYVGTSVSGNHYTVHIDKLD